MSVRLGHNGRMRASWLGVANLALRFLLELAGWIGAGYAVFVRTGALDDPLRWAFAIGTSLAVVVAWALTVAPRRENGLSQPQKDMVGTTVLLVVAGGLALAGQPLLALAYAVLVVANAALLLVFGDEVRERFS